MSVLSEEPTFDAEDYVRRATEKAVAGARGGVERRGGRLVETDSWCDEHGHWLRVTGELDARPGVVVRYARLLLHVDGPDKDAETEGIIYGSGFVERLLTRLPADTSVGDVVDL